VVPALSKDTECSCHAAMRGAIMTAPSKRNPETMAKLRTILSEL